MLKPVIIRLNEITDGLFKIEPAPSFTFIRIYKINDLGRKERCCTVEWLEKKDNINRYRINGIKMISCDKSNIDILICEILKIIMNRC